MTGNFDPLAKTKPLADPLRTFAWFLVLSGAISALALALVAEHTIGELWPGLQTGLGLAFTLCGGALLIAPGRKPNAIYLRAFRSDRETARLRLKLAAILGPEYRLSGIRPPRKKSSKLARFLFPGFVALRYAGSKYMDLEAGDDWMARLWRTYQQTRVVFIDVRELTPHVHREIRMTLETMGAERCIFVVDAGRSEAEWRTKILEVAAEALDPARLRLLDVSQERVKQGQMAGDLRAILRELPPGVPGTTDRGRAFVLANVSPEELKKSQRIAPGSVGAIIAGLGLAAAAGYVRQKLPEDVSGSILGLAAYVVLFLVLAALCRAVARAFRLGNAGHAGAAGRALLSLAGVLLLFVYGVAWTADGSTEFASDYAEVLNRPTDRQIANEGAAAYALQLIWQAELDYQARYPKLGYACSLAALGGDPSAGRPTPQAAQLLPSDVASGRRQGYVFTFTFCHQVPGEPRGVKVFEVMARPLSKADGRQTYCVDSMDDHLVDPTGGTNCQQDEYP